MSANPKASTADVRAAFDALDSNVVDLTGRERLKHLAACKQRRQDLSDDELMLECLFDLFDFDTDERGFIHSLVARSLGKAPEQKLLVNEVELGRLLPGDGDVLEGSFKKRVKRMCAQIDEKQRAKGRLAFRREPGRMVFGSGKESGTERRFASRGEKKLISAEYFIPLVQGVVEGVDMARPGRERRIVRFRRAARAVFDSLPECKPIQAADPTPFVRSAEDVKADDSPKAGKVEEPRPVKKFRQGATLALRQAKERDARHGDDSTEDFDRQAAALYLELGRAVAEVGGQNEGDPAEIIRRTIERLEAMLAEPAILSTVVAKDTSLATSSLVDTENGSAEVRANSEAETQKGQQKGTSGHARLDKSVQAKRPPGRIPDEVVERVRDEADIVRVVESRGVKLTRAGTQYKGLCPFHKEKTPSFFVSPAKGLYHCQGCKSGGHALNFIADYDRVGFRDAVRIVADISGIPLPEGLFERPRPERAPRDLTIEYDRQESGVQEFDL